MKKRKDEACFVQLNACAAFAADAADRLAELLSDGTEGALPCCPAALEEAAAQMDAAYARLLDGLLHAFVTPVAREDLARLGRDLAEVSRAAARAGQLLWAQGTVPVRGDAIALCRTVCASVRALEKAVRALPAFHRPQAALAQIDAVRALARQSEKQCARALSLLLRDGSTARERAVWQALFPALWGVVRACERAAEDMAWVLIKNN